MKSLDEPIISSNNTNSSPTIPSSNLLDPLQEIFITTSQQKLNENKEIFGINKDIESAFSFSSSNDTETINNGGILSNEKIMALFNTPQTSIGTNIRPTSIQSSNGMQLNMNNRIKRFCFFFQFKL